MVKATFSLDDETMDQLRRTAARLGKAQSHVIREAVADYAARADRLSDRERLHLLGSLDKVDKAPATRGVRAVNEELHSVRAARRHRGRRST